MRARGKADVAVRQKTVINALQIQRHAAQDFGGRDRVLEEKQGIRQQIKRGDEEVGARRAVPVRLAGGEGFAEGKYEQEVHVPEVAAQADLALCAVEVVKVVHEGGRIKQVEHARAVEVGGVDQMKGMIQSRYGRGWRRIASAPSIPSEVVGAAIEDQGIGRGGRMVEMLVCHHEGAPDEGPVRRGA